MLLIEIYSKWIKNLKMRLETITLEKTKKGLFDIGLHNDFMDMTSKAHAARAK